jgi:hypothetical protein
VSDELFEALYEELERRIAGRALTIWEAFDSFCGEELLLEPEKLVKIWLDPILPRLERLKNLRDQLEVDPEVLKEYKAKLKRSWSTSINLG